MNKALDIVYVNNTLLGHFIDNVYVSYTKDEKEKILLDIEKEVAKKDYNRKMFSMLIGVSLAFIALLIAFLMLIEVITLGTGQWFNYTYLVTGLFLLWVILYYFLGLIFYPSVKINFHFKSHKANNINSCVTFASSNYSKFIDKYSSYLRMTNFVIKGKNKKKDILLPFGIKNVSKIKNIIFNGSIKCNVPYYYLSYKNQNFLFLPGFIIHVNGKDSKVIQIKDFKVVENNNYYEIYNCDTLLVSFKCEGEFDKNFFYFKFEQL